MSYLHRRIYMRKHQVEHYHVPFLGSLIILVGRNEVGNFLESQHIHLRETCPRLLVAEWFDGVQIRSCLLALLSYAA